nr:myb/SANT-like domain-containing protein [Tanacetum cinerariifolium]
NHKDANGLWDFPFPYFNQLELVYRRDRATGTVFEGFKDAIHNMENEQNDVLDELMKFNISSGDVLHAAEIFAANKDKLKLFLNLSQQLRVSYVLKLTSLSSGRLV